MKILYIHGLSSSGASSTVDRLRNLLPNDKIFSPDLPIEPQEALQLLKQLVEKENIDLVIGTSMGGMFAQKLRGFHKILVNPAFHVSEFMRKNLGVNKFLNIRADGATHYEITEDLCNKYEALERNQFYNLAIKESYNTFALFGTEDDLVDCSSEYKIYYKRYNYFKGGHRLSEDNIKTTLIFEIEKHRQSLKTTFSNPLFSEDEKLCWFRKLSIIQINNDSLEEEKIKTQLERSKTIYFEYKNQNNTYLISINANLSNLENLTQRHKEITIYTCFNNGDTPLAISTNEYSKLKINFDESKMKHTLTSNFFHIDLDSNKLFQINNQISKNIDFACKKFGEANKEELFYNANNLIGMRNAYCKAEIYSNIKA